MAGTEVPGWFNNTNNNNNNNNNDDDDEYLERLTRTGPKALTRSLKIAYCQNSVPTT